MQKSAHVHVHINKSPGLQNNKISILNNKSSENFYDILCGYIHPL